MTLDDVYRESLHDWIDERPPRRDLCDADRDEPPVCPHGDDEAACVTCNYEARPDRYDMGVTR